MTNSIFLDKKAKTQQQQHKKSNIKTLVVDIRELNPGPLTHKANVLPLNHRVN